MADYKRSPWESQEEQPRGQCYTDAWRFLKVNQDWTLVHGKVFGGTPPRWIDHAWVESNMTVWDPQVRTFSDKLDYKQAFSAQEHARYTWFEAAILAIRSGHYGPWEEDEEESQEIWTWERTRWLPHAGIRLIQHYDDPLSGESGYRIQLSTGTWISRRSEHVRFRKPRRGELPGREQ